MHRAVRVAINKLQANSSNPQYCYSLFLTQPHNVNESQQRLTLSSKFLHGTQMKKSEAAHHKFQRRLLGITWRDKVRNEDIRKKTGSRKIEDIKKEGSDGWNTSWEWTTLEQLVWQHTGNWEVTRENQDDQGRTG